MIKSEFVTRMEKQGFFEIVRIPAYYQDYHLIDMIENDSKLWLYAMNNRGVSVYTHANCKSFFAMIIDNRRKSLLNPSYNTKGQEGKHHQDQTSSN
jgi:hypothetical protein